MIFFYSQKADGFNEDDHPRDENGRFSSGGGNSGGGGSGGTKHPDLRSLRGPEKRAAISAAYDAITSVVPTVGPDEIVTREHEKKVQTAIAGALRTNLGDSPENWAEFARGVQVKATSPQMLRRQNGNDPQKMAMSVASQLMTKRNFNGY